MVENTLVLASASPQREKLLAHIVDRERFTVQPALGFEEPVCGPPDSLDDVGMFVEQLASEKALFVDSRLPVTGTVLAADTVVVAADQAGTLAVLGKPPVGAAGEAVFRRWFETYLVGRPHYVLTGVCVLKAGQRSVMSVSTLVEFGPIPDDALAAYWKSGEPIGKAGGYGIQGDGSLFVRRLEGSFSNVVGLPVWEVRALLESVGFQVSARGAE